MKKLGLRSYRFSIEWAKWEPWPHVFNHTVIKHYSDLVDALLAAGIEPVVTLHHFTNPLWFHAMRSFEISSNVEHILRYARSAYDALGDRVRVWCTVNEPEVYASQGYLTRDQFPPAVEDPQLAAVVLKNMLDAHIAIYRLFKSLPGGNATLIGFAKNIFQFDPLHRWSPVDRLIAALTTQAYTDSVLDYFSTGNFRYYQPFAVDYHPPFNPHALQALDYIGLNYYSHYHVTFQPSLALPTRMLTRANERHLMTTMDYPLYAEGFYRALHRVAKLGMPVVVTENGAPDEKDQGLRDKWIRRYLYAMKKAMDEGVDVRGYHYWSFMDNYEFNLGYSNKFGLFAVNTSAPTYEGKRVMYQGSKPYFETIAQYNDAYDKLKR